MFKYKLSIITINLNNYYNLKKTLNNIREFKKKIKNIEYIIIDGKSIDGSINLIKKNEDIIDKMIIEKDCGVYDAMSKGVNHCNSDFLSFINSGDLIIHDGYIKLLNNIVDRNLCYYGETSWENDYNPGINFLKYFPYLLRMPGHQSIIFPIDFMRKNKFDRNFPISADIDHKLIAHKMGLFKKFDFPVVINSAGGLSQQINSINNLFARSKEKYRIAYKHYGFFSAILNFLIFFIWHGRKLFLNKI